MMGFKNYVSFGKVPKTTKGLHNYPMMGLKSYGSFGIKKAPRVK